jgi:hypothetical protein
MTYCLALVLYSPLCKVNIQNYKYMPTVDTTFRITFTEEQYEHAQKYIEDMKKHPERIFWIGKENKTDDELILSHIAHRILSGFLQFI